MRTVSVAQEARADTAEPAEGFPASLAGPSDEPSADPSSVGTNAFSPPTRRVLLVWDAPNLDMGLGSILGRRPTGLERPRFDALGRWLLARTAEIGGGRQNVSAEPEATVFTNIAPGNADVVRPWVAALRNVGFAVFAKPKVDDNSDVDADMLHHIALRCSEGLPALVVASADGQAFRQPLEEISRSGVPVQVLGFREHASWALASDTLEFVDLEDIDGVFREPLPRIGLDSLPEQGAWLQPFRPLSSLLASRV
jgi:uncharacterized protein